MSGSSATATALRVLMPGEWAVLDGDGGIETLLGSCVAVTIWDPLTATGACCHYLLPGAEQSNEPTEAHGKYGRRVIPAMFDALRRRGIPPGRCEYKLFGGGRMFVGDVGDIGAQNIACARELLKREGLSPAAECVGDEGHRKIRLDVATGAVHVEFHPLSGAAARVRRS